MRTDRERPPLSGLRDCGIAYPDLHRLRPEIESISSEQESFPSLRPDVECLQHWIDLNA